MCVSLPDRPITKFKLVSTFKQAGGAPTYENASQDGPGEEIGFSDQAAATQNMLRGDKRFYQPEPTLRRIQIGSASRIWGLRYLFL
jgi:hypothetical protein